MDKESWWRVTVTAPVIWAFRSFFLDRPSAFEETTKLSSLAWLFCTRILFMQFLVLNSSSPHPFPDFGPPLQCHFTFQDVSGSESVDPANYKVTFGFITWQKLTNRLPIMKCLLFASWKHYTTHPLAGYTTQIIGRHNLVVVLHSSWLDFTSRSSVASSHRSSENACCGLLAQIVWKLPQVDLTEDNNMPRRAVLAAHSGRSARYLGPCETGLNIFAGPSNAES